MDEKKEYAKKFFDAIVPKEGEKYGKVYSDEQIKMIIWNAFDAGMQYTMDKLRGSTTITPDKFQYINNIING